MQTGILKKVTLNFISLIEDKFHFDIFIKIGSDQFEKIIMNGAKKNDDLMRRLIDRGDSHYYIDDNSLNEFHELLNKVSGMLADSICKVNIDHLVDFVLKFITLNKYLLAMDLKATNEEINGAASIVGNVITQICSNDRGLLKVFKSLVTYPHVFKHAISVALLSVLIATRMGIESYCLLEQIGMGALLADVGMGQLTFNPEECDNLLPEQRKELWRHPELGKFLLDQVKGLSAGVVSIVMQHHERPNGHGYPNGLRDRDISRPAKIVAVADSFNAMVSKRSYRDAFFASEALKKMKADVGKFDPEILSVFMQLYS